MKLKIIGIPLVLYVIMQVLLSLNFIEFKIISAVYIVTAVIICIAVFASPKTSFFTREQKLLPVRHLLISIFLTVMFYIVRMTNLTLYLITQAFFLLFFAYRFIIMYRRVTPKPEAPASWNDVLNDYDKLLSVVNQLKMSSYSEVSDNFDALKNAINTALEMPDEISASVNAKISDALNALHDFILLHLKTGRADISIANDKISRILRLIKQRNELK